MPLTPYDLKFAEQMLNKKKGNNTMDAQLYNLMERLIREEQKTNRLLERLIEQNDKLLEVNKDSEYGFQKKEDPEISER